MMIRKTDSRKRGKLYCDEHKCGTKGGCKEV